MSMNMTADADTKSVNYDELANDPEIQAAVLRNLRVVESTPEKDDTSLEPLSYTEAQRTKYQKQMQDDMNIDLEEVLPQPINVRFVEWVEEPVLNEDGTPVLINGMPEMTLVAKSRIQKLNTYVPVYMLTKVAAMKRKVQKAADDEDGDKETAALELFTDSVWEVWKLTQPSMTLQRLEKGLDFKQVKGLFARFFGNLS